MTDAPTRRPPLTREDLPADINTETVRRLSISKLKELDVRGEEILSPSDLESYRAARETLKAEFVAKLANANAASKLRLPSAATDNARRVFNDLQAQLRRNSAAAEAAVARATTLPPPADLLRLEPADTDPADPSITELIDKVEQKATVLEALSEIQSLNNDLLQLKRTQIDSNARGAIFAIVVSVAVIAAGVAPLVVMTTWSERLWTLGLTALISAGCWGAYWFTLRQQRASSNKQGPSAPADPKKE